MPRRPTSFEIKYLAQFKGKTVAATVFTGTGELLVPTLEFTDGTSALIWQDPEGNGPGHLALYDKDGNDIYPS